MQLLLLFKFSHSTLIGLTSSIYYVKLVFITCVSVCVGTYLSFIVQAKTCTSNWMMLQLLFSIFLLLWLCCYLLCVKCNHFYFYYYFALIQFSHLNLFFMWVCSLYTTYLILKTCSSSCCYRMARCRCLFFSFSVFITDWQSALSLTSI